MSDVADRHQDSATSNSHVPAGPSSRQAPLPSARELQEKPFWNVPETAFMAGVSARTVWRLMADPKSGFPKPRRVRGRTLLVSAEVMEFMQEGAAR